MFVQVKVRLILVVTIKSSSLSKGPPYRNINGFVFLIQLDIHTIVWLYVICCRALLVMMNVFGLVYLYIIIIERNGHGMGYKLYVSSNQPLRLREGWWLSVIIFVVKVACCIYLVKMTSKNGFLVSKLHLMYFG